MASRTVFDVRDLEDATDDMLRHIDRAVVAAAFKIRDEMRDEFKKGASLYKNVTNDYYKMAEGIMVGKLRNGYVKLHAFGHKENTGDWKARFFVGGTTYRKNKKGNKGLIKKNEAVDKGLKDAESTLTNFIKNAIK